MEAAVVVNLDNRVLDSVFKGKLTASLLFKTLIKILLRDQLNLLLRVELLNLLIFRPNSLVQLVYLTLELVNLEHFLFRVSLKWLFIALKAILDLFELMPHLRHLRLQILALLTSQFTISFLIGQLQLTLL